jgi:serine/threonine protein kinase/WD40 repeat protein
MTGPSRCPPPRRLQALLAGKLSAQQEGALTVHLDTCRRCQQVLEQLDWTASEAWPINLTAELAPLAEPLRQAMQSLKDSSVQLLTTAGIKGERPLPVSLLWGAPEEGWLGPYEIRGVIGRGGMGVVLKAFDPALCRLVAIKVLAPHLAGCSAARRRFAREGRAAAAVSHEHVVAIHAVAEAAGLPYLVMEYVPGISLQERLDRSGPLDARSALRIAIQAAWGLAAAHAQGLVHRDVKPANILLENAVERVKLTDFGLARAVDDARLTQSGMISGTPEYMAPEQARGGPTDHRADLFSLGSVLYAMVTGRTPFHAGTPLAVLQRVCADEPAPVRQLNPAVDAWLANVIAILHAKEPGQRFGSAAELAGVLGQYLTHLEQPAVQPKPPRLARRRGQCGRRLKRLTLLAIAGLLLLAGALLLPRLGGRPLFHFTLTKESEPTPASVESFGSASISSSLRPQAHLLHPQPVLLVAFAPQRKLLATACRDHRVRIWDYRQVCLCRTLNHPNARVWSVAFAPDGRTLATAAGEGDEGSGELFLWNIETGKCSRLPGEPGAGVFTVACSPRSGILAAGGWDGVVRLWDAARGEKLHELHGHGRAVHCLAFSADGSRLASGSLDGSIKVWNPVTRKCIATLQVEEGQAVSALALSPDGRQLAVAESPAASDGAAGGRLLLWDLDRHRLVTQLESSEGRALSIQFSPDGRLLAAGGDSGTGCGVVFLWDTASWRKPVHLPATGDRVECVAFSPDHRLLATGRSSAIRTGELTLWECEGRITLPASTPPQAGPSMPVMPPGS